MNLRPGINHEFGTGFIWLSRFTNKSRIFNEINNNPDFKNVLNNYKNVRLRFGKNKTYENTLIIDKFENTNEIY